MDFGTEPPLIEFHELVETIVWRSVAALLSRGSGERLTLTTIGHSTGVDECMSGLARSVMKLKKSKAV
jgi:hypothetical protein